MKTIVLFCIALLSITCSFAQTMGINYKAVIKDGTGSIIANQTIDVRFNILDDALSSEYSETHTVTTDENGIIIINIGEGTTIIGDYDLIDWGSNMYQLQTEIDIEQDNSFTDLGFTGFKAVPYALNAANAGATSVDGLSDGKADGSSLFLGQDSGVNQLISDDIFVGFNVGIGFEALKNNFTGNLNTANGYQALFNNTEGSQNTANGVRALFSNTAGSGNVALGYNAGQTETGSNALYIANTDTTAPLIYGEFDNNILGFNGDVGIGHQDPLAPIHVKNDGVTNTQTIVAVLESATSNRPTLLFSETAGQTQNVGMSLEYNGEGSDNKMVINSTQNIPQFEFKNTGDLKILDGDLFISNANGSSTIRMADFSGNPDRVLLRQTATNDVYVGDVDNNGGHLIIRAGGSNVLHAKSSGLIGIGTSAPSRQLQLSTNSAGKPGSATWDVTSDRRLKKDIMPFKDGLAVLNGIDPVWFTYNGLAGMPLETNVGTIAQDLQKVAPYLIKDWDYTDDDGHTENYLSVDYGPLTFILVNAVKEQAQEIETLKKTYDNKIKNLEARLLKLEN